MAFVCRVRRFILLALYGFLASYPSFASQIFSPAASVPLPQPSAVPTSIAVGDFNRDGNLDMVVANLCSDASCNTGAISVFLGKGDGSFTTPVQYLAQYQTIAVGVADFNGDGNPDILVLNRCSQNPCDFSFGAVQAFLGNGDGTFQTPHGSQLGGFYTLAMAIADFNGDGKPDVVITWLGGFTQNDGGFVIALGTGDGGFTSPVLHLADRYPTGIAAADFNGDGKTDLAMIADQPGNVNILMGNGDGTFQQSSSFHSGVGVAVQAADINGDGVMDLAVVTQTQVISYGNGDGTFWAPISLTISPGSGPRQVAMGDFSGDGRTDLAVAAGDIDMLVVFINQPNGTFKKQSYPASSGPIGVVSGDLNHDGALDLMVLEEKTNTVDVFLNTTVSTRTTTTLTSSLNPSIYGQTVALSATVKPTGSLVPTGNVVFGWSDGGQLRTIAAVTLNASGTAILMRSNLNANIYPLTTVYSGDAYNASSTSSVLNQVIQETTSAATLMSSLNPSTLGEAVTFTATITSPTVKPTGPVTFTAGKTVLGTAQLSDGKAKFTTSSLAVGSTTVKATYYGDSNIAHSSASVTQTVQ